LAEEAGRSAYPTGLPGYNGHAYITANIQHPGAAEDLAKYGDDIKIDLHRKVDVGSAIWAACRQ
jgi:hypothetical protein